jgi:RNA polymerase sigma-70 factor (ECF subfamily)
MHSDAQLLAAARTDPAAFRALYERYAERVLAFHQRRSRDADAAHDLTAETFAQAWLARKRFRDEAGGSAAPWLYGIANNVLRDSLRKRRVEDRARRRLGLPTVVEPDPEFERVEQRLSLPEAALRAIEEMPAADRAALDLRVVHERPYSEVAARLRCTPEAARLRVSRALRRLNLAIGGGQE